VADCALEQTCEQTTYSTKSDCMIESEIKNGKRLVNSNAKDARREGDRLGHADYFRVPNEAPNIMCMTRAFFPVVVPVGASWRRYKSRQYGSQSSTKYNTSGVFRSIIQYVIRNVEEKRDEKKGKKKGLRGRGSSYY
jgi:hypothetical protein